MQTMVRARCREVVPYLFLHLKAKDPFHRSEAIYGLGQLGCRECRQQFIDIHLADPDDTVRSTALSELNRVFKGERDEEILRLALTAFDDPKSSVAMRLTAGAVMMYQLQIPGDELGGPGWWNGEEEDLEHPSIVQAVAETRKLLAQ